MNPNAAIEGRRPESIPALGDAQGRVPPADKGLKARPQIARKPDSRWTGPSALDRGAANEPASQIQVMLSGVSPWAKAGGDTESKHPGGCQRDLPQAFHGVLHCAPRRLRPRGAPFRMTAILKGSSRTKYHAPRVCPLGMNRFSSSISPSSITRTRTIWLALRRAMSLRPTCILALLLLSSFGIPHSSFAAAPPANILLIVLDDIGYGDPGFQPGGRVPTPRMDALAKKGLRFTQAYCAAPYCAPSRVALLTGRYPVVLGHEENYSLQGERGLHLGTRTLADLLRGAGYATCAIGKWHLGDQPQFRPTQRGFDAFYGTVQNSEYYHPRNFVDSRVSPDTPLEIKDDAFYTTTAYADRAVEWIAAAGARPWFLYLAFNAVHSPLQAPQSYLGRFPQLEGQARQFAACLAAADDAVGRVLDLLRERDLEKSTLVLLISDNGGPTWDTGASNGSLNGFKGELWEGGVRVPMLASWPGVLPSGEVYEHPVCAIDLVPTALAAAEVAVPRDVPLDGVNLLPHLTGQNSARPHQTLFWRMAVQWAVRDGDWKLHLSNGGSGQPELYDLATDPGETRDLAPAQPEKRQELQSMYERWNATLPAPTDVMPINAEAKKRDFIRANAFREQQRKQAK